MRQRLGTHFGQQRGGARLHGMRACGFLAGQARFRRAGPLRQAPGLRRGSAARRRPAVPAEPRHHEARDAGSSSANTTPQTRPIASASPPRPASSRAEQKAGAGAAGARQPLGHRVPRRVGQRANRSSPTGRVSISSSAAASARPAGRPSTCSCNARHAVSRSSMPPAAGG